jgi:hypothetical protein
MSFNRLDYDTCTYSHNLKQSVGVGHYMYDAPRVECQACFPSDPTVQIQKRGGNVCSVSTMVDASSELLGLTRKATNCPTYKFLPSCKPTPCPTQSLPDCQQIPRENTRLSNPPCTLRGTGWNRWEWLCKNPQDKALIPFDYNISNRLIVKDNHRPCIPTPISGCEVMPAANADDGIYHEIGKYQSPIVDEQVPSTHWRKCQEYANYF